MHSTLLYLNNTVRGVSNRLVPYFCDVGIWWDLSINLSHNNTFSHKYIAIPLSMGIIRIFYDKFVGKDIDNNRK